MRRRKLAPAGARPERSGARGNGASDMWNARDGENKIQSPALSAPGSAALRPGLTSAAPFRGYAIGPDKTVGPAKGKISHPTRTEL
jgi:hypothetical protein